MNYLKLFERWCVKKKILIVVFLIAISISCFACAKSSVNYVMENMSELTKVYYWGENNEFYCSLSSGEREEDYAMDGKHKGSAKFALLSFNLMQPISSSVVKLTVIVDGEEFEVEAEINSLKSSYLVDLERELDGDETVEVIYQGKSLGLDNLSNQFQVDYQEAIEIACKKFEDKIFSKKQFNNLNAECYLRILDKKANNFDGVFWCFTVLNVDNENYSIIISTADGSILAQST